VEGGVPAALHYNAAVLIEAEAIPYEPALLRGERLLVLAPHPDDEVIGCGGLIAQHLREKRAVRVVIATDGAEAGTGAAREEESRRGLAQLGDGAEVAFLRFRDRALDETVAPSLREELRSFRPDLILVPSPIEIHPDHLALARAFCELIQHDPTLFAELAIARVAFYEVGQPIRPNALVDISDVAADKYAAITEHVSQLAVRDYVGYARGLNAYRAMTLPAGTKFAEGYFVVDLPSLRTTAFSALREDAGSPREIAVVRERPPVSVVIRTKDRPQLLREAIDSVLATRYPCEIVVVNDGGATPVVPENVRLVSHTVSRGRAEAGNAGARAAKHPLLAFLDDDDLFYPEHLDVLTASSLGAYAARYTDAVSSFLRAGESGTHETYSRLRLFAHDYDRELLVVDNYIPLPTLLVSKDAFLDLGGFDTAFDLFEDWDFLIRLSQRGDFLRIPKVTCEIRHFEGGSSIVLAAPEGSERFRKAKLQIWQKHASLVGPDLFASVLEREKKRNLQLYSDSLEREGRVSYVERDAARAAREMTELQNTSNGYMLRVRELEGALQGLQGLVPELEARVAEVQQLHHELEALRRENDALRGVITTTNEALGRTHVEIGRLNGLLEMIYGSKSWKLHLLMEKMRGRG
jgi:LmbE family N-acetylglucosaminyl deacetylase/GT2 family glycosyltransferase